MLPLQDQDQLLAELECEAQESELAPVLVALASQKRCAVVGKQNSSNKSCSGNKGMCKKELS